MASPQQLLEHRPFPTVKSHLMWGFKPTVPRPWGSRGTPSAAVRAHRLRPPGLWMATGSSQGAGLPAGTPQGAAPRAQPPPGEEGGEAELRGVPGPGATGVGVAAVNTRALKQAVSSRGGRSQHCPRAGSQTHAWEGRCPGSGHGSRSQDSWDGAATGVAKRKGHGNQSSRRSLLCRLYCNKQGKKTAKKRFFSLFPLFCLATLLHISSK